MNNKHNLQYTFTNLARIVAAAAVSSIIVACGATGEEPGTDGGSTPEFRTDDEIIADVMDYMNGDFTEVKADFTSDHGGDTVAIFVKDSATTDYAAIDSAAITGPTFAEGTMIIKQHKDGNGADSAVTVMYKQADGFSDTGNWWWARLEADGSRTVVSDAPSGCLGCHNSVSGSDFVYGNR